MPVPPEFERASAKFYELLERARDLAYLQTTNQAYTMVQGVLLAFRARLEPHQAIAFANALPLLLRALFVTDWDPRSPPVPFADREALTAEVKSLRGDHNFSPDDAILCVARAVRPYVEEPAFQRVLASLPPAAAEFWRTD